MNTDADTRGFTHTQTGTRMDVDVHTRTHKPTDRHIFAHAIATYTVTYEHKQTRATGKQQNGRHAQITHENADRRTYVHKHM